MNQKPNDKNLTSKTSIADQQAAFISDLKHFGYLLPTNDDELEEFKKIFGTTKVMLPAHLQHPSFPLKKKSTEDVELKPVNKAKTSKSPKNKTSKAPVKNITANDYFKKLILAAEITTQLHNDYFFGHIKLVKVQYLCSEICNMKLNSNYGKYAAGPLDPKLLYSIDAEFKKRKWFKVTKTSFGYKYEPDVNADEYKKYYSRYFSETADKTNYLISLFRNKKANFCEVVATLFAVWKECINKNTLVSDSELYSAFYQWNESKNRFDKAYLTEAMNWMREKEIIPVIG